MSARIRQRIRVTGVVQGVGFRPFVYDLATRLGLGGAVRNMGGSVQIDIEGPPVAASRFRAGLAAEAPGAARIDRIEVVAETALEAPAGTACFSIEQSCSDGVRVGALPPDLAPCPDCLAELADPTNRRFGHPFISCTQCGPRFTIVRSMPYDRHTTTMSDFEMCAECRAEYDDPTDRRHHAQPISCWSCGPRLMFSESGRGMTGSRAIAATIERLRRGDIVGIKGVGGYHLAVDAMNRDAVLRLRRRKQRPDKPFAVMVPDIDAASAHALLSDREIELLQSNARPIVLVARRATSPIEDDVAPGSPLLGLMLPSSPLHQLLFAPDGPIALVMTSGNLSGEPICHDDADAFARLTDIVDEFLHHDRAIHHPCDDSVVRVVEDRVIPIRRSRGMVPSPISLPFDVAPMAAAGGDLKNVFAFADGTDVWLSQHLGDLETLGAQEAMDAAASLLGAMSGSSPALIATDAHAGYHSHRWGRRRVGQTPGARHVEVQHHHAHGASLMADNALPEDASLVTFAFDGTGLGSDGTLWGGEVLRVSYRAVERLAHLRPMPLPGGDHAAGNPCWVALGLLAGLGMPWEDALPPVRATTASERDAIRRQLAAAPRSSSMGRLFDAVASLVDLRHRTTYEAQAAIELEHLAGTGEATVPLEFGLRDGVIDPAPVLVEILRAWDRGATRADIAASFHAAVAAMIAAVAEVVVPADGPRMVGLTGGVFQNAVVLSAASQALEAAGFAVMVHRQVPPNDGGLALGQVVAAGAACRSARGEA